MASDDKKSDYLPSVLRWERSKTKQKKEKKKLDGKYFGSDELNNLQRYQTNDKEIAILCTDFGI